MNPYLHVAVVLAILGVALALVRYDREPEITAKHVEEARDRKSISPCDFTIIQYGPGERWISSQAAPTCSSAARAVPANVLTSPVKP